MATKVKLIADGVITPDQITLTTASTGTNTTAPATTAFVQQEISALVDSSPDALNTLNELAAALGNDANFSTTVTNNIATKLPLAGGTMTGSILIDSSGSASIGLDRGNDTSGSTIDFKTGGTLKWYMGLRGLSNDNFYLRNEAGSTDALTILTNGKVGIGTTSPRKVLHVKGNESSAQVVEIEQDNNAGIAGVHFSFNDTTVAHLGMAGASYTGNSEWTDKFFIGTISDKAVVISQNDTAAMIIDTNQNVGIGTESPSSSAKLDVNGVLALKGNDFLDSDTSAHYIKAPTALYFYTNASDIALELKQNMLAEFRKPSSRIASFGLSDANDKYITFYNSSGNFDIGTHTSNRHYLYGSGDIPISFFTNTVERATIDDKGIKQYNRFVSGTILPTAFVGCDSWYDLSGRYSTVVTSGNDLTSCTDASGEGRATLIKNTVATGLNNNATLEQFPSGIYGFRFDRASYITGTSHTSGYTPPTGTNARTLWCIIYNLQEITGEPINHFLHYGSNSTSRAFGVVFTTASNEFGQHTWAGSGREVDADDEIAGGFTDNGTTPRDVYVLFSSYDGGTGETRVYRGGMEGVSSIGSISIDTGAGYALHVGSRINADNSDENCDVVIGEFGAFSRRLTTKEMDLLAHSLLLRWS